MRMVVVFPAPFGPRKPRISPFSTRNETPSTAVARPYLLVRLSTSIIRLLLPFSCPQVAPGPAAGGRRRLGASPHLDLDTGGAHRACRERLPRGRPNRARAA